MSSFERLVLACAAAGAALAVGGDTAHAGSLKDICLKRCSFNRTMCLDSTLPSSSGESGNGGCDYGCVDTYSDCSRECDGGPAAGRPSCLNACNASLSTCTGSCHAGRTACNDTYSACRNGCDAILECTRSAHCRSGQVCERNRCVRACRSNAECERRLGSGAGCMTTGVAKGLCALQ